MCLAYPFSMYTISHTRASNAFLVCPAVCGLQKVLVRLVCLGAINVSCVSGRIFCILTPQWRLCGAQVKKLPMQRDLSLWLRQVWQRDACTTCGRMYLDFIAIQSFAVGQIAKVL